MARNRTIRATEDEHQFLLLLRDMSFVKKMNVSNALTAGIKQLRKEGRIEAADDSSEFQVWFKNTDF